MFFFYLLRCALTIGELKSVPADDVIGTSLGGNYQTHRWAAPGPRIRSVALSSEQNRCLVTRCPDRSSARSVIFSMVG